MKILTIGDLHFGEHGNSPKYNEQLLTFLEWCVTTFPDVDKVVQLGDFYHHRNKIDVLTLNYGIAGAKLMSSAWGKENVFVLSGNHDLYYLDRLDVSSIAAIDPYVTVVDDFSTIDDGQVLLTPWVTDSDMWEQLIKYATEFEPKYCFGHFELNNFMVNDAYMMKDGYSPNTLTSLFEYIMSGHYHSPQEKDNINYVGTPLPITMNEANERHGVWVFDTDTGEREFFEYDKVKVVSIPYDQLTEEILTSLDPDNTSIRIEFPDDLEDETLITEVSEILNELNFKNSKIKYRGKKVKDILDSEGEALNEIENIDGLVIEYIRDSIDVSGVDNPLLLSLYEQAIQKSAENTGD